MILSRRLILPHFDCFEWSSTVCMKLILLKNLWLCQRLQAPVTGLPVEIEPSRTDWTSLRRKSMFWKRGLQPCAVNLLPREKKLRGLIWSQIVWNILKPILISSFSKYKFSSFLLNKAWSRAYDDVLLSYNIYQSGIKRSCMRQTWPLNFSKIELVHLCFTPILWQ